MPWQGNLMRTLFILFLLLPSTLLAEERALSSSEMRELLTGNTAIGFWIDHNYRQWFDASGTTIYAPEHGRSSRGRWRLNDTTDEYESEWGQSNYWEGYKILQKSGQFYWISDGVAPQPFKVVEGQDLVWPAE